MLTDLHHFLRDFTWNAENAASLVIGLLLGAIAAASVIWWWRKLFGTRGDHSLKKDLQEEQGKTKLLKELVGDRDLSIRQLEMSLHAKEEQIEAVTQDCEHLKEDVVGLDQARDKFRQLNATHKENLLKANAAVRQLRTRNATLHTQLKAAADHIQAIVDLEGRFWEKPPMGEVPAFRQLKSGKPPIIALVNLKGGVGKTTITANLGATLWEQGYRTLLADLDNQGSLTALCLPDAQIHDVGLGGGRFVHHVFQAEAPDGAVVWDNLTHLGATEGRLLAATEVLADVEEHAKATWLLKPEVRDVRYDLRRALHDPVIQDRFDAILLDCPPRLSTACINALTCCDYVLIPVLLDKTSMDAVPRLLKWLRLLQARGVCPELRILGVLANRTRTKDKLGGRERDRWSSLADKCAVAWGEPVHLMERWIPNKASFADAAESRKLAALDDELAPIFKDLLAELKRRNALHDRRGPAAVRA
jgi:cellulose biosynthesis protein BcsQ